MNPVTHSKNTTILPLLIPLTLALASVSPTARAVVPPPDGGYPGFNTAEGQNALFSLTTGVGNAAVGAFSLFSVTEGSFNTATGAGSLLFNAAEQNTAMGAAALLNNTTGGLNTAIGTAALNTNINGFSNTAAGVNALLSNIEGSSNVAIGANALSNNVTGDNNTAIGANALLNGTTGSNNVAIGLIAGSNVSTAINVTCIGAFAAGADVSNTTWISNVYGVTTQTGLTAPVIVSDTGQLGTVASSERFKKDIATMEKASEAILSLRPVTFHYKTDVEGVPQFGLIAEEVAKVNPALVLPDKDGKPYTVRYDAVNAMLLNEFLKEHRKVEKLEALVAQQRKDFEAALTDLKGQIQRVSAQLELNKVAPQTVLNSR
jgi:hypothetical protein